MQPLSFRLITCRRHLRQPVSAFTAAMLSVQYADMIRRRLPIDYHYFRGIAANTPHIYYLFLILIIFFLHIIFLTLSLRF